MQKLGLRSSTSYQQTTADPSSNLYVNRKDLIDRIVSVLGTDEKAQLPTEIDKLQKKVVTQLF